VKKSLEASSSEDPEIWVYSKEYYKFVLDEKMDVDIGLHQRDQRLICADNGYHNHLYDLQILLLKVEPEGTRLIYASELEWKRDLERTKSLKKGKYILIPRSTGCQMEIPKNEETQIPYLIKKRKMHPYFAAVVDEIFRKYDENMDGLLSVDEINDLGKKIKNEELENLIEEDLRSEKWDNISCNESGLSKVGLKQLFTNMYYSNSVYESQEVVGHNRENFNKILKNLGFNINLNWISSRVYVVSLSWEKKIDIEKIDAVKCPQDNLFEQELYKSFPSFNHYAWSLLMEKYFNDGYYISIVNETIDKIIFRRYHHKWAVVSYGIYYPNQYQEDSKNDTNLKVQFTQIEKDNMLLSPKRSTVKVFSEGFSYLGAGMAMPGTKEMSLKWTFKYKKERAEY